MYISNVVPFLSIFTSLYVSTVSSGYALPVCLSVCIAALKGHPRNTQPQRMTFYLALWSVLGINGWGSTSSEATEGSRNCHSNPEQSSSSSRSTTTRRDIHTLLLNVYEERLHNFPAIDFPERTSRLDYLFIAGEYIVEFVGNCSRSQDNNSSEANSHWVTGWLNNMGLHKIHTKSCAKSPLWRPCINIYHGTSSSSTTGGYA